MARTSESEVRDIYSAHPDGTRQDADAVEFWIDAANILVDDHLAGSGMSSDRKQKIEALLAAHGLASGDPTEAEGGMGNSSVVFEGATAEGSGLFETRFGRRAVMLDNTGNLAQIGKAPGSFEAFGPINDT